MKIYLVRRHNSAEIHGIFWAKNMYALWDTVDEMGDPVEFEWAEIKTHGGIWHDVPFEKSKDTPQFMRDDENSDPDFFFHDMTEASETLLEMMGGQLSYKWTRFSAIDGPHGYIGRLKAVHG
jgi:hypothetical protein